MSAFAPLYGRANSPDDAIENRGPAVLTVTIIMIVLSTVFFSLRMISRFGVVKRVASDDYFMVLAWLIALGLSVAICYGTSVGLGRHEDDIPEVWHSPLKKSEYAFSVLYNPALMATKTSICLFYLTLAKSNPAFKWLTILTMAVVNVAGIILTFLNIFQCRPVSASFMTPIPSSATCDDIITLYLSSAPVNIITDLIILFLPMPILTGMRLPKKQKIILIITFSFGFFVAVVDVVRIVYLQEAATKHLDSRQQNAGDSGTRSRNTSDIAWYASLSFMWSAVEVNVGIMCACVPGLKPLVSRFLPRFIRDVRDRTSSFTQPGDGLRNSFDAKGLRALSPISASSPISPRNATFHALSPPGPVHASPDVRRSQEEDDGDMDIFEFLNAPHSPAMRPDLDRMQTAQTFQTQATLCTNETNRASGAGTFFDFVAMERRKSFIGMTNAESVFPLTMVTILFFVWGLAYGFLDVLNGKFQAVAGWNASQTISIHCIYFGAYFIGALTVGRWTLIRYGFKACFMVGLILYSTGSLVFWPSAVLSSLPAFLVSNFIVGFGLSILEIASNPFVALCGPQEYMEIRLNLSQGIQAIGTVLSPLLATKVLFNTADDAPALVDVQWTYLAIAMFTFLLAVLYFYLPLPEASRTDLAALAPRQTALDTTTTLKGIRIIWITLGFGVLCLFLYVGGQESVSTSFGPYIRSNFNVNANTDNYLAVAHTVFALSRFVFAGLNFFIKPRVLLAICFGGAALFSLLCTQLKGAGAVASVMMIYACEGPIFSLVYAMCLRGMGRYTKDASALLTAAIAGGSIIPPIQHAVVGNLDQNMAGGGMIGPGYSRAYWVMFAVYLTGTFALPLWTNACKPARLQVDPIKDSEVDSDRRSVSSSEAATGREVEDKVSGDSSIYQRRSTHGLHWPLPLRVDSHDHQPTTQPLSLNGLIHPDDEVNAVDWQK